MGCAELEQLVSLALERVDAALAGRIRGHLDMGCSRCEKNWAWARRIAHLAVTDDSVEPPDWVVRRAITLFLEDGPRREPNLIDRLVAALVFDNLAAPQLAGVRDGAPFARQCLYRAGQWDIDISYEPSQHTGNVDLTGQVLKSQAQQAEVETINVDILQNNQVMASTTTNHLGEFTFERIPRGHYALKIDLHDQPIWIEEIDVNVDG